MVLLVQGTFGLLGAFALFHSEERVPGDGSGAVLPFVGTFADLVKPQRFAVCRIPGDTLRPVEA